MSVNSHQIQAAFARRREIEHQRSERVSALNRYYDHWGKVTTRYGNWTKPEYYEKADKKLQDSKEKIEKEKRLNQRQDKLKQKLDAEKIEWAEEIRFIEQKPKAARKAKVSTETLEKIEQNVKETERNRRRLELEAKLYGKLRHGVLDENLLFDSNSDHKTMAKLNWLDKQVEEQMNREKEEAAAKDRELLLQQEINKTEQMQKERQQIREKEIKEIRELQEKHIDELRERQTETDTLKEEEALLRSSLDELDKELELLEESSNVVTEPPETSHIFNLRNIKVFLRSRSDVFRNQIKLIRSILDRIREFSIRPESMTDLLTKYKDDLDTEAAVLSKIEGMYESEAKTQLQRCEEAWQSQHITRYHEVKQVITQEQNILNGKLNENLKRQEEIVEVRSAHLASIENSNERLKQLIKEQDDQSVKKISSNATVPTATPSLNKIVRPCTSKCVVERVAPKSVPHRGTLTSSMPKVTNSFNNLNLDVWKNMPPTPAEADAESQRSLKFITPDTAERPKYARKRIAWT